MTDFADRVAVVTGAGSGIGRALAQALAGRGARVVLADIDEGALRTTEEHIRSAGGSARAAVVDVSVQEAVYALVDDTLREEGRLDLMINNAGIGAWGDVRQLSSEQWRRVVDINLWGAVHGSLAAYVHMTRQGSGHIVNVASLAGLLPAPLTLPYAVAKHGVVGLSLSLRAEGASLGVRVSAVCPGPISTQFHRSLEIPEGADRRPNPPPASMDVAEAAAVVLRGVERNRALILVPDRAHRLWLYWRYLPSLIERVNRATVRRLREAQRLDGRD